MIVFIVDDDPDDIEVFCAAVADVDSSIKCMSTRYPEKALEHLWELVVQPSFIFLDINMPVLSGKDLLQEIKADSDLCEIPVVMYSTSTDEKQIADLKIMGAKDYLIKPAAYNKLVTSLRTILGTSTSKVAQA